MKRSSLFPSRPVDAIHDVTAILDSAQQSNDQDCAERAVLGALLADNTLFSVISDVLDATSFGDSEVSSAYERVTAILENQVQGISVATPTTVAAGDGVTLTAETLSHLSRNACTAEATVRSHAILVANAAQHRKLVAAAHEAQLAAHPGGDAGIKAERLAKLFTNVSDSRSLTVRPLGAVAIEALTRVIDCLERGESPRGIPTGIAEYDAMTGGMHPGQMIVVAARPGVGKSAFALSIALNAAGAGYSAAPISLEMLADEVALRAVSSLSGVGSHELKLGALDSDQWTAAMTAADDLSQMPIQILDLTEVTLTNIKGVARRLRREGKLDVLFIDYLQIMESEEGTGREQQVSALSRGLKKLAIELQIPVVVLSQLNRDLEKRVDKRPILSDLRESGAIEQDADVIVFLYRDEMANPNSLERGVAEVNIAKQRGGATGTFRVGFDGPTTHFFSLPQAAARPTNATPERAEFLPAMA